MPENLQEKTEELQEMRSETEAAKPAPAPKGTDKLTAIDEAKRMNDEAAELERATARMNAAKNQATLAGRGEAGQVAKVKTQEDIDQEAADKLIEQFNPDAD